METGVNTEFVSGLRRLWHAENLLVQAMPLMIEKATAVGLKKNLALHWAETSEHRAAVQAMCRALGVDHTGGSDGELEGLLQQGKEKLQSGAPGMELDAVIAASARRVEAWEMQAYPPVAGQAEALGYEGMARRLWQSFEEERQADGKLQFIENRVMPEWGVQKTDTTGRTAADK